MSILAVDLDPANELLTEAAENPLQPGSLAARMAAALLTYARYTPIVDLITLRICIHVYSEYELLNSQLEELQNIVLRTETIEVLLKNSHKKVNNLRVIFIRLVVAIITKTSSNLKLSKFEKFIEERDKLREFLS